MTAPGAPRRAVGIDIGSNTLSFAALELRDGRPAVTQDASLATRLSERLAPGGPLSPAAVARSLAALAEVAPRFGVPGVPVRAVATQALRMAADPEVFTRPAREILGADVEIVDGDEEARLVFRGGTLGLDGDAPWIVVDIGGQSTELCWRDGAGALVPLSIPVGVVGLTERFIGGDPPASDEVAALERCAAAAIIAAIPDGLAGEVLGVAGTATSLGALEVCPGGRWCREAIHGAAVSRARLRHWLGVMAGISIEERTERYGIGHARADVFLAGLVLLDAVLARLGVEALRISVNGLRVGAALSILGG
jgi:exopolyphosphatase / guanosine-5'-triphosphate,3'-diphosphate pyrophosphatase